MCVLGHNDDDMVCHRDHPFRMDLRRITRLPRRLPAPFKDEQGLRSNSSMMPSRSWPCGRRAAARRTAPAVPRRLPRIPQNPGHGTSPTISSASAARGADPQRDFANISTRIRPCQRDGRAEYRSFLLPTHLPKEWASPRRNPDVIGHRAVDPRRRWSDGFAGPLSLVGALDADRHAATSDFAGPLRVDLMTTGFLLSQIATPPPGSRELPAYGRDPNARARGAIPTPKGFFRSRLSKGHVSDFAIAASSRQRCRIGAPFVASCLSGVLIMNSAPPR